MASRSDVIKLMLNVPAHFFTMNVSDTNQASWMVRFDSQSIKRFFVTNTGRFRDKCVTSCRIMKNPRPPESRGAIAKGGLARRMQILSREIGDGFDDEEMLL
jgi:hypothetical protein